MAYKLFIIILCTILNYGEGITAGQYLEMFPCKQNNDIKILYSRNPPREENFKYYLYITLHAGFFEKSAVQVKLDSDATVTLSEYSNARISTASNSTFTDILHRGGLGLVGLLIKGSRIYTLPHIESIVINNEESCEDPNMEILDQYFLENRNAGGNRHGNSCGRRKVSHVELIFNGQDTKPGDWPWHAAIYYTLNGSLSNYICGGTLLSKTDVLTAAHCVTFRGVSSATSSLKVILGKYNLFEVDSDLQEREVEEIIVHEQYEYRMLNNDIALLKLKSEVVYTNYIQPVCLWNNHFHRNLSYADNLGTVVGFGYDKMNQLSRQLHKAMMPIVSELDCIRSHPLFFAKILNDQKFCAGYRNGTSACNGDSGGGFVVFIPDVTGNTSGHAQGSWYIRGIVSTSVSRIDEPVCDPSHYVVFTDVFKLREWITRNME